MFLIFTWPPSAAPSSPDRALGEANAEDRAPKSHGSFAALDQGDLFWSSRELSCGSCGDFTMRNGENNRDSTDLAIILMLVQWDGNRMGGYSSWASLLGEGYAHGYN